MHDYTWDDVEIISEPPSMGSIEDISSEEFEVFSQDAPFWFSDTALYFLRFLRRNLEVMTEPHIFQPPRSPEEVYFLYDSCFRHIAHPSITKDEVIHIICTVYHTECPCGICTLDTIIMSPLDLTK